MPEPTTVSDPVDVLMVEDQEALASSTVEYLTLSGVSAAYVSSAEEAHAALASRKPKLVLLDVNLPGLSGFEFCRRLRRERGDIPIVFVSARTAEDDQILALSLGGDDYIAKPYSLAVLLAKIRRMLDRLSSSGPPEPAVYDDGWLLIDPGSARVRVGGRDVSLAALEFKLLEYLVANRGRVVEKRELFRQVWGGAVTGDGTLSVHIRRLRTRIERDPDRPRYIRTVWGRGYIFEEPA